MWLSALMPRLQSGLDVQWLIVPRHPQRVDQVQALLAQAGLRVVRRSGWSDQGPGPEAACDSAEVWLGDSLGEMALYYGLADVALLGGSFAPLGGQNLIEACACGCPVVMGPHTFNFLEAAAQAEVAGAARRVVDMAAAVRLAQDLAKDATARQALARAGLAFAQTHKGAARRVAGRIKDLLAQG